MKTFRLITNCILTTVALTLAVPALAADSEEAHSRTELTLPPAVADAIREQGGVTGDHAATTVPRPGTVAADQAREQEVTAPVGPSTAAPASEETPVSAAGVVGETAATETGEDYAMDELLAILDGDEPAAEGIAIGSTSLGTAGASPMAKALPVTAFACLLLIGMLAHPRTRKLAFGKLVGENLGGLGTRLDEIAMHSSRTLAGGQQIVTLEIDGQRVLVGVSEGRMDVLHTWEDTEALMADADKITERMFDPGMILSEARRPSMVSSAVQHAYAGGGAGAQDLTGVNTDLDGMRRRVAASTPSPEELLAAFKRDNRSTVTLSSRAPSTMPATPSTSSETPWWMEGADESDRARLREKAESPATNNVMKQLRAARARGLALMPERAVAAQARRAKGGLPPRPMTAERADVDSQQGDESLKTRARRAAPRFVLGLLGGLVGLLCIAAPEVAMAQDQSMALNLAGDALGESPTGNGASTGVKLLITLTLLAVAPAIILSMTSFTRLIVIFSLMRQAVGVQQAPPNQILIGLALFLTWFIMGPTFTQVNETALKPYFEDQMTEGEALEAAMVPMRKFMLKNTRKKDLALFLRLSGSERPQSRADVPTRALVPAFIISELKTAFQIGFLLYIPFLIIDLVVATVLLAMGMMVLPPVVISLPFKLLLFVFIDGWNLLIGSVVRSFA